MSPYLPRFIVDKRGKVPVCPCDSEEGCSDPSCDLCWEDAPEEEDEDYVE